MRRFRLFETVRDNAVNAASIISAIEIEMLFYRLRQRPGMLDDLAIHIRYVERTVRSVGELYGSAPIVGGSNKFNFLFIIRAAPDQADAFRVEFLSMDQITATISNKGVAACKSAKTKYAPSAM